MQLCLSFPDQQYGAVINGLYRYLLWRIWDPRQPRLLWVMLNPSTADETTNDPTLRRILGFSRACGFGGLEVVNLFACTFWNYAGGILVIILWMSCRLSPRSTSLLSITKTV